jgi:hypothetical protein
MHTRGGDRASEGPCSAWPRSGCSARTGDPQRKTAILLFDPDTGRSREFGAPTLRLSASDLVWLPDGFLVIGAEASSTGNMAESQLWMLPYPEGEPRRP